MWADAYYSNGRIHRATAKFLDEIINKTYDEMLNVVVYLLLIFFDQIHILIMIIDDDLERECFGVYSTTAKYMVESVIKRLSLVLYVIMFCFVNDKLQVFCSTSVYAVGMIIISLRYFHSV